MISKIQRLVSQVMMASIGFIAWPEPLLAFDVPTSNLSTEEITTRETYPIKCVGAVIGETYRSCRHPLNQPIYNLHKNDPKCGVASVSRYNSDPSCKPIWKSCNTVANGIDSRDVVKSSSYTSRNRSDSGTTYEECEAYGYRYAEKLNNKMSPSERKTRYGSGLHWELESYNAYYADTRSVIGNVLVRRDYLCDVNLNLIEENYKYGANQACGLFGYEECVPVYNYKTCRLPEFGIETYEEEPRPECGSAYEIKAEGGKYQNLYCSTCDHLEEKDRASALEKYICILNQSKIFAVQKQNRELRQALLQAHLPQLTQEEVEKIFNRVTHDKTTFFGINLDLNSLGPIFLSLLPSLASREQISAESFGYLSAEHHWESLLVTSNQLAALEKLLDEQKLSLEFEVLLADLIVRLNLGLIFQAEGDLAELKLIKYDVDRKVSLNLKTNRNSIERIESSKINPLIKQDLIEIFKSRSSEGINSIETVVLTEVIDKLSQKVNQLHSDFSKILLRFQERGKEFETLRIYQGILDLNGPLLQRDIYQIFVIGQSSSGQNGQWRLSHNIYALLQRRVTALKQLSELMSTIPSIEQSNNRLYELLTAMPVESQALVLEIIGGVQPDTGINSDSAILQKAYLITKKQLVDPFLEAEEKLRNHLKDSKRE